MDEIIYPPRDVWRVLPSYVLLFLVGCLDLVTGREVHLGSIYLLVIAVASWNICPRALILFAAATVAVWSGAEWLSGVHFTRVWIFFWNVMNHVGVVSITATMVAKAKSTLDRQQRLIRDLGQTLLKISQYKELVPVCRVCHELHFDEDYRAKLDELLAEGADMASIGDICPGCLEARASRVAAIPVDGYFNSSFPEGSAPRNAVPAGIAASPLQSARPAAADGTPAP